MLRLEIAEAKMHGEDLALWLIRAIPSLDVEALAELTGGEVERLEKGTYDGGRWLDDSAYARVVTPWRSVTSPEGES